MFRKTYLILCAACLFVRVMGVLYLSGNMHFCESLSFCHGFITYLAMSVLFFYLDPLLLSVTLIWLIRTVKRVKKYPKENIYIAISWLIVIGTSVRLIGYSG
jgi:hypothetical protein